MCLKMAAQAEDRMNLAALQQRDPYITDIVDTASQVALYSFSPKGNEWEKTSIEGTLFVYKRSASPINGFMILNRLGLNNLIEPIIKGLEFQLQDPFLLYRNTKAIYGIWFYDKDECARIGQLMNCLVQLAIEHHNAKSAHSMRQRRASESDSMQDRPSDSFQNVDPQQVDIIQMLSKAQHEYVKSKGGPRSGQKPEPKPMIDNPNAAATKTTQLIRPRPVKLSPSHAFESDGDVGRETKNEPGGGTTPTTSINLEALFRNASINKQRIAPGSVEAFSQDISSERPRTTSRSISMCETSSYEVESRGQPAPQTPGSLHPLLQRLMSSGPHLESIERQQLSPHHPPGPGGDVPPPVPLRISSQQNNGGSGRLNLEIMGSYSSTSPTQSMSFSIIKPQEKSPEVLPASIKPDMLLSTQKTGPDKSSARNLEERIATICSTVSSTDTEMPLMETPKALLTPAVFEMTSGTTEMFQPPLAVSLPAPTFNPDVLLSPMVFTTTSRISPPVSSYQSPSLLGETTLQPMSFTSELSPPVTSQINPLTKQQLQQALVHLLQTDSDFIKTIHEAYLRSLTASLSTGKS